MTNHKYILLLSLILSTTIFSCKNDGAGETMTEQEPESRFITVSKEQFDFNEMKLAKVELIDYSNTLQLNGNVILNTGATANISSPMEGKITGLKTRIGEYVRKGETLFSVQNLELIQMQQQYLELESQMAVFEEEFARKENLYKENVVVKSDFTGKTEVR
ncbi:MAG TPA: efflux RND transporter periplasmic adaptor subunit [Saprospiraceae bacterium]|nr:efflux RND transporter periplasmic adaptor subunit [Saprospiraceae bacterium]